jgi:hypothetical protein
MTEASRPRATRTALVSAALALTAWLACGTPAQAAPVFVQMTVPPTAEFFSYSTQDATLTADDFMLGSTTSILAVTWQGENGPGGAPGPDAFHILFYTGASTPTTLVGSFNVGAANRSEAGFTIADTGDLVYNYWANLGGAGFLATAGTRYWISIVNDAVVDPVDLWTWAGGVNGLGAGSINGGASWFSQTAAPNFTLDAAPIPEPATLGLVAFGLIGLVRARKVTTPAGPARSSVRAPRR